MDRLNYICSLFVLAITLFADNAGATHIMGGNITYQCVGQDSFLVRASLYRDCGRSSQHMGTTITLYIESDNCPNDTVVAHLLPGSGNDITPLCPNWPSPCDDPQSPIPLGVEEYIYEVLVVLPPIPSCRYTIAWKNCCRNYDITAGSAGEPFYLFTDLDRGAGSCNQSPQFGNVPVPYICTGKPFSYNHGVFDPDGDSLVFSLGACRKFNRMDTISFVPGLGPTQPLWTVNPIQVDSQTGTVSFTPSINQVAVICVRVEEYDRLTKKKIGEVIRDMQIVVTNCLNEPPVASPINGTQDYDTAVCPGQGLTFDIFSQDSGQFQNVFMSWNGGIPSATFTINPGRYQSGTFTWNPGLGDIGTHFFAVRVIDDGCPITAQGTYGYVVDVRNPKIDLGPDLTVCDGDTVQGMVPDETVDFTNYKWTPTTGIVGPTSVKRPLFSPTVSTQYVVEASNGFCLATDTIMVLVDARPSLSISGDTTICYGDSTILSASGDSTNYLWSTNEQVSSITVSPSITTNYEVKTISGSACENMASVTVIVNPLPDVDAGPDDSVCIGEPYTLRAMGDGNQFMWQPTQLVADPNLSTTLANPVSPTTFTVTNIDTNGCQNFDTVRIELVLGPQIGAYPDTSIILGQEVTLASGNTGTVSYIWSPDIGLIPPSTVGDATIVVSPGQTTVYTVEIVDANGCRSIDSVVVSLLPGIIDIPNAFTPNGDGLNDEFYLLVTGHVEVEFFRVYNRWGELIFESSEAGPGHGWDGTYKGKDQPVGSYTYVFVYRDPDTNKHYEPRSGSVTLIR